MKHRLVWTLATLTVLMATCQARAEQITFDPRTDFDGGLRVVLHDALFRHDNPDHGQANLVLDLQVDDGRWRRVYGYALNYSNGVQIGLVQKSEITDSQVKLTLAMSIVGDFWVKDEGTGFYEVTLSRKTDGQLTGTYKGRLKGHDVSGPASGAVKPPRLADENRKPFALDEHPRMLLRKSELPALKAKLNTPLGKAYLAQITAGGDIVSLGMAYQLTGKQTYADRAAQVVRSYGGKLDKDGFGSGGFGHQLANVIFAYDLCYDAWPADLRKHVEEFLVPYIQRHQGILMTTHANFHPCSNYYGPGRGVPALGTLAMYGIKGPEPKKPRDLLDHARELSPAGEGFTPGRGVPVVTLDLGKFPAEWLVLGPAVKRSSRDLLAKSGGYAKARPHLNQLVEFYVSEQGQWPPERKALSFEKLDAEVVGADGIDLAKLTGKFKEGCKVVLYNVLKVEKEQSIALAGIDKRTRVFLNGWECNDESYYTLKPGLYPMLVVAVVDRPAGRLAPRPVDPTSPAVRDRRVALALQEAFYEQDKQLHERLDGANVQVIRLHEVSHEQVKWHYQLGIGRGGFQAETGGYANIASWYPLVYASAYRMAWGRNPTAWPDVQLLMPRRMMQTLFKPGGDTAVQKLNSATGFDRKWVAAAMPITPEKYQPALLWGWNHVAGVPNGDTSKIVETRHGMRGYEMAHAFVNYPTDLKPVHPSKSMPLQWQAETFGFHVFRNGWDSADDFIAQIFLKSAPVGGWNHPNGGAFRLMGLGQEWATGPTSRNGARQLESVVQLPDDEINKSAGGQTIYRKTWPDGSAVMTADMGDIYVTTKDRKVRIYDPNLIRLTEGRPASPITGLRSWAFDYSGTGGAPCVMAMVDKIQGGGKRVWTWHVPPGVKVETGKGTFTFDAGAAKLTARFIAPTEPDVRRVNKKIEEGDPRHGFHGMVDRIEVEQASGSFFVVVTVQRGKAPKMKVEGKGLDATVTVGKRTIRFDGTKFLLDKP